MTRLGRVRGDGKVPGSDENKIAALTLESGE
jgi:hypothetical protein